VPPAVRTWLCNEGFDPVYGARPINRLIQKHLMNPLATALLEGTIHDEDTVAVELTDDHRVVVKTNH
jgi:ATP-dependent Clp protease ATP-binding subunit ClpB